jgi:hypothetical protein
MPDVTEALDHNRFDALQARSVLASNLWLSLNLAAQRGDADDCKRLWEKIRTVSVDASDLLKALGSAGLEHEERMAGRGK